MINAKIFLTAEDKIKGFAVTGHSNTAEYGRDIICAGVSSLTQTALLGVGRYLERDLDFEADSGNLTLDLKEPPDELTEAILQTMLLGLQEIEKLHPNIVKIELKKVN